MKNCTKIFDFRVFKTCKEFKAISHKNLLKLIYSFVFFCVSSIRVILWFLFYLNYCDRQKPPWIWPRKQVQFQSNIQQRLGYTFVTGPSFTNKLALISV